MKLTNELQHLLEEVADICDSGVCYDMKSGADRRYDSNTYGEGLSTAYQSFIATKEGGKWYSDAVSKNHEKLV